MNFIFITISKVFAYIRALWTHVCIIILYYYIHVHVDYYLNIYKLQVNIKLFNWNKTNFRQVLLHFI